MWNYTNFSEAYKSFLIIEKCNVFGSPKVEINCIFELDYFSLFLNKEIIEILVLSSNNYINEIFTKSYGPIYKEKNYTKNSYPYLSNKSIDKDDIYSFVAILIFMGMHRLQV